MGGRPAIHYMKLNTSRIPVLPVAGQLGSTSHAPAVVGIAHQQALTLHEKGNMLCRQLFCLDWVVFQPLTYSIKETIIVNNITNTSRECLQPIWPK